METSCGALSLSLPCFFRLPARKESITCKGEEKRTMTPKNRAFAKDSLKGAVVFVFMIQQDFAFRKIQAIYETVFPPSMCGLQRERGGEKKTFFEHQCATSEKETGDRKSLALHECFFFIFFFAMNGAVGKKERSATCAPFLALLLLVKFFLLPRRRIFPLPLSSPPPRLSTNKEGGSDTGAQHSFRENPQTQTHHFPHIFTIFARAIQRK